MGTVQSIIRPPATSRRGVQIQAVSNRSERDEFVRFPWEIYRNDPQWVPPLLMERKAFIDPAHHPFYEHGEAVQFLARRQGRVVGRILVSDDPHYNLEHSSNVGCFGMFESIDDEEVAHALLDRAEEWLSARGRTGLMGPIDYSTNYSCGLLVDGFDTPPRVMMNHNPRYYAGLLESYGLAKAKDLYSWWFDDPYDMATRWQRRSDYLAKRGVTIRSFSRKELAREIMRCKSVYNDAWCTNWGFVRMTDAEFHYYSHFLSQLADPQLLLVAEVDGEPVGFSMTLPDFNEALRPLNGRLMRWGLPLGWFKFQSERKRIRTARLVTLGILKQYRRRGIAEMLILHTLQNGKNKLGYRRAELGWTLEDNDPINRTIATVGGRRYKTYRIYQKPIGGAFMRAPY